MAFCIPTNRVWNPTIPVVYYMFVKRLTYLLTPVLALSFSACYQGTRPAQLGTEAPQFTVSDSDHTVSLKDYRGKIVVLNFWATWCPPCVEEMPSLIALQKDMGPNVVVLAVSTDVDDNAYHTFIRDHHVDFVTVRDAANKSNALYGTYKFPETYIIDKDGKIRRKFIGAANWTSPDIENFLRSL
ncbi:MAG TPA: TlpA disulfide reductase family protein [Candidatus Koribacter sp.]|jgi:peroxiredoxin